ncbi:hypothetical protein [Streptomyces rhizosphaerihabitans]|nr:hypothetical protein [Streptomyces rhizosphaerihabitans]MCT9006755.1 hypothetical protein [Streptomyces rhizosphaerihabitans]
MQRKEPAFPSPLCESLVPLPSSLHPAYPPPSPSVTSGAAG